MNKASYFFVVLFLIVILFISVFSGGCSLAELLKTLVIKDDMVSPTESSVQGDNTSTDIKDDAKSADGQDSQGGENNKGSSQSKASDGKESQDAQKDQDSQSDASGFKDNIVSYQQYSDIMFYSPAADFAFVYPQNGLAISSNPYLKTNLDRLFLSVDIASPGEIPIPADLNLAYEPSIKKHNISGTAATEFIIFSRDGLCDVAFERSILFKNYKNQVLITLAASRDEIIGQCSKYFKTGDQNCGSIKKIWDMEKIDDFYNELILGKACKPATDWYETFNEVIRLLQINEFKGASAGYSRLIDKRIFDSSQEDNYIISASYPEFQPAASESLDESLNKYIYDDIILENISAFKDEIAGYDKEQNGSDGESLAWQYGLTIEYEVITYTDKVVSLLFNISPYLGGAHGMAYLKTINFDLENNRLIDLSDIFNEGFDYLAYISDYCRQDLEKQMHAMGIEPDKEWINEGTNPADSANYSRYLIGPDGLIIKFEAYQVAPWVAGDFSVLIQYK
jgi:hypothetical protein